MKCRLHCRKMEEKDRSVNNLPVDISKANPGSQKAVPVNAWLLAYHCCHWAALSANVTVQGDS